MRVIFTGGGTAGHVVPNLAVIEDLKHLKKDVDILYIGSSDGIEKKMVATAGINYKGVSCGKLRRYFSFQNFLDLFKVPVGIFQAYNIIKKFSPNIVFCKGGFVSVPSVIAAWMQKIPVIIHESDLSPGLANRLLFKFATRICLSFEESRSYVSKYAKKIEVTGNPVRKSILSGVSADAYKFSSLNKFRPIILIMGGSLGSRQINELVDESIDELLKKFQIIHIRGKGNINMALHKPGYVQYEYLDKQLSDVYAISEMIVSRGGANSLFEIEALNKKALIIPLSGKSSRGEQMLNAKIFANRNGWGILEGDINAEEFSKAVELSYRNRLHLKKGPKVNASKKITELIIKLAK